VTSHYFLLDSGVEERTVATHKEKEDARYGGSCLQSQLLRRLKQKDLKLGFSLGNTDAANNNKKSNS
jgi:hypothetical protein